MGLTTTTVMEATANRLFELFQQADYAQAAAMFSPGARVYTRYGPGGSGEGISYAEFQQAAASGPLSKLGNATYLNRKVTVTSNGFVEQHTTQLTVGGNPIQMPCTIVCSCDSDGLITSLEEYLDPSPIKRALSSDLKIPETDTPPIGPGAVVLITGASSGIGEDIAVQYAEKGCFVVLAGRRKAELDRVGARCRSANFRSQVLVIPTDVSDEAQCAHLVRATVAEFGDIDRLVLNAGISHNCFLKDFGPGLLKQLMDVNFMGSAAVAQAALPHLMPNKSRIVVVSSALGKLAAATQTGYAASKWALHGFFDSLRCELQSEGITVTLVCPGPVNTGILGNLAGPSGSKIGLSLDDDAKSKMMTSEKAAKLTIQACEEGMREIVFGKALQKLVQLRASQPTRVDQILSAQYISMHQAALSSKQGGSVVDNSSSETAQLLSSREELPSKL